MQCMYTKLAVYCGHFIEPSQLTAIKGWPHTLNTLSAIIYGAPSFGLRQPAITERWPSSVKVNRIACVNAKRSVKQSNK